MADPAREKLEREAERRWAKLAREHAELAGLIAVGRGVVALLITALPNAVPVALTPESAREKLAQGLPLLADEDLRFDWAGLRSFLVQLCDWVGRQPDAAADAARVKQELSEHEVAVEHLLAAVLTGGEGAVVALAAALGVAPGPVRVLASYAATAALLATARELAPLLDQADLVWDAPRCPVCGGPPLLAERQGSSGQRMLRCAVCGAAWRTLLNRCIHCGNEDPAALHYLATEGQEEKYRVDLCDHCRGYLKSLTSFSPTPAELLLIEDIALLYLEVAARERGYRATPPGVEATGEMS